MQTSSDKPQSSSRDDGLDDADALPAVGRVWTDGPKRSLGEILAAASRQKQQAAPPAPSKRDTLSGISGDLAGIWPAALQQVHDSLGAAVHVPLSAGIPSKDGSQISVRFGGTFAAMTRYLERYREQIQKIVSEAAGQEILLRFDVDETIATAPAPQSTAQNLPPRQAAFRPAGQEANSAPAATGSAAAPAKDAIPLTPELRAELEKEPLIRAVLEQLGGTIVKVE